MLVIADFTMIKDAATFLKINYVIISEIKLWIRTPSLIYVSIKTQAF